MYTKKGDIAWFRPEYGTKYKRSQAMIFVDFKKAFDKMVYMTMTQPNVNLHSTTNKIMIKSGVSQGDSILSKNFITVLEHALKGWNGSNKKYSSTLCVIRSDNLREATHVLHLTIQYEKLD